jgi:hypothetical protein
MNADSATSLSSLIISHGATLPTVDSSGVVLNHYTLPDNLPSFPDPPFVVSRDTTGFYDVNFLGEVFDEAPGPVVVATIFGSGLRTTDNAHIVEIRRSFARIQTGDSSGLSSNRSFSFTAVGTYGEVQAAYTVNT